MTGAGRRSAAVAAGIAFHIVALGAFGLIGLMSVNSPVKEEPIYEVALMGSGSPAAAPAVTETAAPIVAARTTKNRFISFAIAFSFLFSLPVKFNPVA